MSAASYRPCPVLLLTARDRTRYLHSTIHSVLATLPDPGLLSVCCDNISQQSMDYLTTGGSIWLGDGYRYPNDNADWIRRIGPIENKTEVMGLNNRVKIWPKTRVMGHDSLQAYLQMVVDSHRHCEHVILIEDDVVFKQDWYLRLCQALSQHADCGVVAGFRYPIYTKNKTVLPDVTFFEGGYSAVCLGISVDLIRNMARIGRSYSRRRMIRQDDWIMNNCAHLGLRQAYLNSGVCQHIGVESATWGSNAAKPYMNHSHRLSRVDKLIMPPFVLGNY